MRALATLLLISILHLISNAQIIWNDEMNVAPASNGNNHPRIVTDGEGNPLVLWWHNDHAMLSKWNGVNFESPTSINPHGMSVAGASWMGPDIASHGDTVYVVFKEAPEHHGGVYSMRSIDGGETFADTVRIDHIGDSLGRFPAVTVDADGNPIVAFMKFNSTFGEAQWAVSKSIDHGNTYAPDVLASGWSSGTSHVCDCCPGSIVSTGENVAMLYRDNNSNIRDTWAGLSTVGGRSFTKGLDLDQHGWMIMNCPASGPDGVIIADTLYSTFMNGATGRNMVYFSKVALSNLDSVLVSNVTGNNPAVTVQNFPRIANYNDAVGVVYRQVAGGQVQVAINFTTNIAEGLPVVYDTVNVDNVVNVDIAIYKENIYVVWEDGNSGTVRFRSGEYTVRTDVSILEDASSISVYPNPTADAWTITREVSTDNLECDLFDINGRLVSKSYFPSGVLSHEIGSYLLPNGLYFLRLSSSDSLFTLKLLKS